MTNTHPHYLYSDIVNSIKADKAVITAMTGLMDGTIAYATDTNEFGTYSLDTNTWTWVGASALLYIQDEGIPIGTPTTLNFVGNNVDVSISGTVSTANNSESNSKMTVSATNNTGGATSVRAIITAFVTDVVELNSKTTHYFNARATTATPSNIYFSSDVVPLFFTAECAYL